MKKWICWLLCSIFCITSSKAGLYEEFYPAIYEAIKVQQFYEDKENNLAVNGDSFTYNSNFLKEIEKRSDFIQFNKIKVLKVVEVKGDAIIYFSITGFTIPTVDLSNLIETHRLEKMAYPIASDMNKEPLLWNSWNLLKAYVKFDESTWKYMYSDSLRKWQTEDINEELLLQEDFSKIHIKNTYEDGALLYNKLLEILYRNPHKGNQDIFILETDSE